MKEFPSELKKWKDIIEEKAKECGLDFFPTIFEIVNYDEMNQIVASGGYPTRYPHWSHGQDYLRQARGYRHGLSKIYEMVINNDPCYAYLLESNPLIDQKMVMAHVYGHCDFFKNNMWYDNTNRKMLDEMGNHRRIINMHIEEQGLLNVEKWIDTCLILDSLIDIHSLGIKRYEGFKKSDLLGEEEEKDVVTKLESKKFYLDDYINPRGFLEREQERIKRKEEERRELERGLKIPEKPEKDVLLFLIQNAPLENWQREIMDVIREESYYFTPQAQTHIMNEGWASYWTSEIMRDGVCEDSELIDYGDHFAGTMGGGRGHINPYKLGIELFRAIKERWDKGKFGKEWEECLREGDYKTIKGWDKKSNQGLEKIFETRRFQNDITFLDHFLTREFCEEQKLFTYDAENNRWALSSRDFGEIKKKLLLSLTNSRNPVVYVQDGNYKGKRELMLVHQHEGLDLDKGEALKTLKCLFEVWNDPVHILTIYDKEKQSWSFDEKGHHIEKEEKNLPMDCFYF